MHAQQNAQRPCCTGVLYWREPHAFAEDDAASAVNAHTGRENATAMEEFLENVKIPRDAAGAAAADSHLIAC